MAGITTKKGKRTGKNEKRQAGPPEAADPKDSRYPEDEVAIEKVSPVKTATGESNAEDDMIELSITSGDVPVEDNQVALYTDDEGIREEFQERQKFNAGSQDLLEKLEKYNSSSPDISADDVDAGWEYADQSGDETVGGTNPTPDQDIVDDLGAAAGLTYQDHEAINFDMVYKRDVNRWELNPESNDNPGETDEVNFEWSDYLDRNFRQPRDIDGFQIEDDELDTEEDELDEEDFDEEEDLDELDDEEPLEDDLDFEDLDDLDDEELSEDDIDSEEDALS
jgi:hypothetical protein